MNQPTIFLSHCCPHSVIVVAAASGIADSRRMTIAERTNIMPICTRFASRPISPITIATMRVVPPGSIVEIVSSLVAKLLLGSPVAWSRNHVADLSATSITACPIVMETADTMISVSSPLTMLRTSSPRWCHIR